MKFEFMKNKSKEFSIEKMAKVFEVSTNGYYSYIKRRPSSREEENRQLMNLIEEVYREGRSMYGSPRVHGRLRNRGIRVLEKELQNL